MSKIKKKNEIKLPTSIIGCIAGVPGIGKSTLALSAPKPLLLDTDNGCHRVQAEFRTDTVQVESYQDILDVLEEDLSDYETIVIDTLGELVNFMLKYFVDKDKSLITKGGTYNIKIWVLVKQEFENLKIKLQLLHKNLIFVSHVKAEKDGENVVYRMNVAGSTPDILNGILDFLGFCEMVGKTRSISFSPSERFYAKNSIQLEDYIEIPTLKLGDVNNFLDEEIIKPTIKRRQQEGAEIKNIEKQLNEGRELIENSTDPNDVLTAFKSLELNAHNKITLFKELQKKYKKTHKFNKENGVFENVEG